MYFLVSIDITTECEFSFINITYKTNMIIWKYKEYISWQVSSPVIFTFQTRWRNLEVVLYRSTDCISDAPAMAINKGVIGAPAIGQRSQYTRSQNANNGRSVHRCQHSSIKRSQYLERFHRHKKLHNEQSLYCQCCYIQFLFCFWLYSLEPFWFKLHHKVGCWVCVFLGHFGPVCLLG